jgi:hypothetical protein
MCQALTSGDLLSRMFFPGGDSAFALEEVCGSGGLPLVFRQRRKDRFSLCLIFTIFVVNLAEKMMCSKKLWRRFTKIVCDLECRAQLETLHR